MVKRAQFDFDDSLKIANVEKNDPIPQISDELKAAMINECVEKLVCPQVLAIHYKQKHLWIAYVGVNRGLFQWGADSNANMFPDEVADLLPK